MSVTEFEVGDYVRCDCKGCSSVGGQIIKVNLREQEYLLDNDEISLFDFTVKLTKLERILK